MQNEVSALATDGATVSVISDSQRKYAAWVGGSMLGSLPTIQDILIRWVCELAQYRFVRYLASTKCSR